MKSLLKTIFLVTALSCSTQAEAKDTWEDEYHAVLSAFDHYNSSDEKLTSVADIIRQDRANYHNNKHRDEGDESDSFFANKQNRDLMDSMVGKVKFSKDEIRTILNRTPVIYVRLYTSEETGRKYLTITVREEE